jgi:arylsulfatase A-like enzyme
MNSVRTALGRLAPPGRAMAVSFLATLLLVGPAIAADPPKRSVLIFVADGLRLGSVTPTDTPTIWALAASGVRFTNAHSVVPTLTMPNAAAIASGHYPGDSGFYGNTIYAPFPLYETRNFGKSPGTNTPFLEDDQVLADLKSQIEARGAHVLPTLLAVARENGFLVGTIGKVGASSIQDIGQLTTVASRFAPPSVFIINDTTGSTAGIPIGLGAAVALLDAGLPFSPPFRLQWPGDFQTPGVGRANVVQQQYFADVATTAILPLFAKENKPFVLIFWSRDPDGTQHAQGDSLNDIGIGINGITSRAAVRNADANLKQLVDYINSRPEFKDTVDIIVTSDHGMETISKSPLDGQRRSIARSYSTTIRYSDEKDRLEVGEGMLPPGFLAIELAHLLGLPLFDPDVTVGSGDTLAYIRLNPERDGSIVSVRQFPIVGNGLIGGTGRVLPSTDASVVVVANGGSDLIYLLAPDKSAIAKKIVEYLLGQDYVAGVFADQSLGSLPGTLATSGIELAGTAVLAGPALVVNFRSFSTKPGDPNMTACQVADTFFQQGQGVHGGLNRAVTQIPMLAVGPDFKRAFVDESPVSNADIPTTIAAILGLALPITTGHLTGRRLVEALADGPDSVPSAKNVELSEVTVDGKVTRLEYQSVEAERYIDAACILDLGTAKATNRARAMACQ